MPSPEAKQVHSPCINVCRIDPFEAVCIGCFRTIEEIAMWPDMSDDDKRALVSKLEGRKSAVPSGKRFQLPRLKIQRLP